MKLMTFKDFVNEAIQSPIVTQNIVPKAKNYIYLRNEIQKDLWNKVLRGQLSDGKWESSNRSNWRFWHDLESDVDAQNPRVTKQTSGNATYNFSAKDLLDSVGAKMIAIGQTYNPNYNKRSLITDLNDIADICRSAASWSSSDAVSKSKKRILSGFDDKDTKRITDIVAKSIKPDKNGNVPDADEQLRRKKTLAGTMAKAIDDGAKALRRAKAAESSGEEEIASIFYGRVADLQFGDQWRASTTLRDMNNKLGIFDLDFDLDDPDKE